MTKKIYPWLLVMIVAVVQPNYAQNVTMEKVASQCEGTPYDQRIRVSVTRFSVSTRSAQRAFGDEMATMLSSALQEVNCFRVLESVSNLSDMTSEIAFGQEGFTASGSSPQAGKMLGPQLVVTGEVTEFAEGSNKISTLGIGGKSSKAHIGFILKVLNPETREIVFSKSVDVEGRANGFTGATILGVRVSGSQRGNIALTDAIEKGIIKAVELLATNKDNFGVTPNSGVAATKVWNASNCPLVRGGDAPKVMVIIPEFHINSQLVDPAGETEIIRKFVNTGFAVVDPSTYAALRGDVLLKEALQDPSVAASIGVDYGADIVVIGEAFSELVNRNAGGMVTCRARVEARAVQTADGRILAADGLHAGAADVAESTSSKAALRNAGGLIADSFLASLCTNSGGIARSSMSDAVASSGSAAVAPTTSRTQVKISGADFSQVNTLYNALKGTDSVEQIERAFSGSEGTLTVEHTGSFDNFLDAVAKAAGNGFEITEVNDGQIGLVVK
ncbi:MAG: CsgG/HfaB family protein [Bacteroidota bacterium]